jgi:phosphatidylglycerol:prolipoprotein diacylglycerol transferase
VFKIIDPVAFYIGPLAIRWYGIIISTAILTGLLISLKEAKRTGIDQEIILDFTIWAIPVAIIGARLYYVLFSFNTYRDNLLHIFAIRQGGLAIHGAILGGLLVLVILTKRRNVSFWKVVDIFAPGIILGQAIGRWGNFINQEAYGGIVSQEYISHFPSFISKQMYINGAYRHPTFLYESIWNIIVFIVLLTLRKKKQLKTGDIFIVYAIGYSVGRFFIEGMRTDSLMLGPLRIAQVVSAMVVISGILFIYYRHKMKSKI